MAIMLAQAFLDGLSKNSDGGSGKAAYLTCPDRGMLAGDYQVITVAMHAAVSLKFLGR